MQSEQQWHGDKLPKVRESGCPLLAFLLQPPKLPIALALIELLVDLLEHPMHLP